MNMGVQSTGHHPIIDWIKTDKESSAIDAKIVSFIDELAVKVRGKIVG